ncbi:hypothetical protein GCM10010417_44130 [Streptomyces carpaticus]
MKTADAGGGGEDREAERAETEDLAGVQHLDRQHGRAGRVQQGEGDRERTQQRVRPQPPHTLGDLRTHRAARPGRGPGGPVRTTEGEQQDGGDRGGPGPEGERQRQRHPEQDPAERAADEVVGDDLGAHQAAVGEGEAVLADDRGQDDLRRVVDQHLGEAQGEGAQIEHGQGVRVGGDQQPEEADDERAGGVHGDHDPPPVEAVGEHPGGEGEQQPRQPQGHAHGGDEEGVVGEGGGQPGEGDHGDAVPEVGRRGRPPQPREATAGGARRSLSGGRKRFVGGGRGAGALAHRHT